MLITVALANARKEMRTTFVSTQAEYDEIGLRFLAARSAVDLDRLREARLHERDWLQVGQAISHELPIELVSTKLPYLHGPSAPDCGPVRRSCSSTTRHNHCSREPSNVSA